MFTLCWAIDMSFSPAQKKLLETLIALAFLKMITKIN